MRRLLDYRNPAALVLALCLVLGGLVQAASAFDASPSSERWQAARDIAAIASTTRVSPARAAHLHRSPVTGLKLAGFQAAAALQVSTL